MIMEHGVLLSDKDRRNAVASPRWGKRHL